MADAEHEALGVVLSGATTSEATFQPLEPAEGGRLREGMLVLIETARPAARRILARIGSIVPHNVFYTEGDPFSEARRKDMPIPSGVARQYETCNADLLLQLPLATGGEIDVPPRPGDRVYLYTPSLHEKEVFGRTRGSDRTVWFGTQAGYAGAPAPLDVENIPMHMAIFGVTGSGKSYTMGALIEGLSAAPLRGKKYSYPMIVIDANGDYSDYVDYRGGGDSLGAIDHIWRVVFPEVYRSASRARRAPEHLLSLTLDLNQVALRDLSEMIVQFYRGSAELSELQINGIQTALENCGENGLKPQDLFTDCYEQLVAEVGRNAAIAPQSRPAILRALRRFRQDIVEHHELLGREGHLANIRHFLDTVTRQGDIAVFDFSADGAPGVDMPVKQFAIGYLSSVLFDEFTRYKQEARPRYLMLVIEEAQNFCPNPREYPIGTSLAKAKLSAIATQGRKFGLSLCLISQRPSFVDPIVLSMCNSFFVHRVSPEDVTFVRRVTGGLPGSLVDRLTRLPQGLMVFTGQMSCVPFPLLLRSPEKRVVQKHTAGKTNVMEGLARLRGGEHGQGDEEV